jgi:hypothetical protein
MVRRVALDEYILNQAACNKENAVDYSTSMDA